MTRHPTLYAALAAFQDDMPTIPRTRTGQGYDGRTYTYADLADMHAAARPILSEHGLVFVTAPGIDGDRPHITGSLVHVATGEWIEGTLPLHGRHPQEVGSALTYARRYLLGCLTGLVTDDDDDGAAARSGRPAQVEAIVNPNAADTAEGPAEALREALAAATTTDELRALYVTHSLGSAPEPIKAMYRARVEAIQNSEDEK